MSVVEQGRLVGFTTSSIVRLNRRANRWTYLLILAITVTLTPVMAFEQVQLGSALLIGALAAAALVATTLRWPVLGFYTLTFCAVVIEEDRLAHPIGTDSLYIFAWPARLAGLPERPIGFYILFILLLLGAIALATRKSGIVRGGPLLWPFLAFLGCVALGVVHGLTSGGQLRIIVLEVRPFWYLFTTYLVAYNLVTEKRHIITFFWILTLGTFFKALQGAYIVFIPLHGHLSGVNEIMAHEQSYFFVLVLLLILLSLLTGRLRALMWASVASLPFLGIALVANNRRADYVAFFLGVAAVWLFAIVAEPSRRKRLGVAFIVCAVVFGLYVLGFGFVKTPISAPANAVISVVHPSSADARDTSSNLYRAIEDFDLKYTERQSPIIGYGFGKPFLQPETLPNIVDSDPYYLYIPHNNMLWVWMRLGPLGYVALWYLLGAAIVRAGVFVKRLKDPDLRLTAMFAIGAIIIEIPLAYGDYQLYFYRNVFFIGITLGILMKLPQLDTASADDAHDDGADDGEERGPAGAERASMRVARARARVSAAHDSADARDREAAPMGGLTAQSVSRAVGAASAQLIARYSSSSARLWDR